MKHIFVSLLFMLACGSAFSNSLQKLQPEALQPLHSAMQTRIAVDRTFDMTLPSLAETNVEVGDDEVVYNLENGVVGDFIKEVVYPDGDYSFTRITDYNVSTSYKKYLPSPVTIEAPMPINGAKDFLLETYRNETLVRSDTFSIDETPLKIWNLIPQARYSYKLYQLASDGTKIEESKRTGSFRTEGQVRMMNIEGMSNFRDLGGWKLPDGKRIKYDRIFRSGELERGSEKITDAGIHELLDVQNIGVEIDFSDLSSYSRSPVSGQLDYYNGTDYDIRQYANGLKKKKDQFKNCFNQVVGGLSKGKKVLFHCDKGNHRTGTFAFLLEGLLGVSESDLAKDYELTNFKYPGCFRNEVDSNNDGYKTVVEYINNNFSGNTLNEKIEQMALGMGIKPDSINLFRSLMIEPDVADVVEVVYNLENDAVEDYMKNVVYPDGDYSSTSVETYQEMNPDYRKDRPSPVTIEAPMRIYGATDFLLETYRNETLVRSDTFSINETTLKIWNLIPQARYSYKLYQLAADGTNIEDSKIEGSFRTEGQVRLMNVEGMDNFRDLGGWKLPNGKRIKYDKIFRSSELETPTLRVKITEAGIHELLDVQKIGVEIDFGDYGVNEDYLGSPVAGQLDYFNGADYQIFPYAGGLHNNDGEQYKNCFKQVVASLRQGKKILFHCNAGADRTGTFAFLLEGLLGVSESDLAKDYELTNFVYSDDGYYWKRYRNLESADHKNGYKGVIWYVNNKFSGNNFNEKIVRMALEMGISRKDINDFRNLMTEPDGEMTVEENDTIENGVVGDFINKVVYPDGDYSSTEITTYMAIPTNYWKDLPSPVRIEAPIPDTDDVTAFLLETYRNETLVRSDSFPVAQRVLEIWNLIPQTQYTYKLYQLASDGTKCDEIQGTFRTEGQVRMMFIDGMYNFRDIGGWKLADGKRIKYDKIFRSSELEMGKVVNITDAGKHELLDVQKIGVEIDFGDYPGSPVADQLDYFNGAEYQIKHYTDGLQNYGDQYRNCFNQVVAGLRQGKKILFHCNQGADRTGTFAFLLEGLLGVPESDLAKDYELTNFVFDDRYRTGRYRGMVNYVNTTFNGNTLNEKIEDMARKMGILQDDIDYFRSVMTESDVEMTGNVTVYLMVNSNYMSEGDKIAFIARQRGTDNQTWGVFEQHKSSDDMNYPNILKASFDNDSHFNEFYLFRMPSTYDGTTNPWGASPNIGSANLIVPTTTTYFSVPADASEGFTCKSTTDIPDFDGYYMTSNMDDWARNTKMTEVSTGVYNVSFSGIDYAGKLVTWAPGYAFNAENKVEQWDHVLRPNEDDNNDQWINFANYAYNTLYHATGADKSVWYLPHTGTDDQNTNEGQVTISYTPSTNSANITCAKSATIGDAGYITYSNGELCTISGATAYSVGANNISSVTTIEMPAETIWPANEGMLLKGNSGTIVTINAVDDGVTATEIGTNYLVGIGNNAKYITATDYTYGLCWSGTPESCYFRKVSVNGTLAAHTAYLDLSSSPCSAHDFLSLGGETTGINTIDHSPLTIDHDAPMYNLAGQRVGKNYKGVVIVNGKKILNNK